MNGDEEAPRRYRVSMSEWVLDRLRELAVRARQRGDIEAFLTALREFHRRLSIYPQFGDPLIDLAEGKGRIHIGTTPPLVIRYGILEEEKIVLVAARPVLMPKEGKSSKA